MAQEERNTFFSMGQKERNTKLLLDIPLPPACTASMRYVMYPHVSLQNGRAFLSTRINEQFVRE